MTLRVVAGSCRGRRLVTPKGDTTRPTADRVREATFNSLKAHGLIEDAKVLDLFAGSGAMGIEALSRGADHVTFVDSSKFAIAAMNDNLATCGFSERAIVVRSDVLSFLKATRGSFDLVLVDPPYGFDNWDGIVSAVDASAFVFESDRPVHESGSVTPFADSSHEVIRERRYGTTVVTIAVSRRREHHDGYREDRL